ncbi:MAG: T9SS type A sorting domain-containing protein [Bacteroidia bacterium]
MKKTITLLCFTCASLFMSAQVVADFESFSLPANSYYKDTTGADFQTTNAVFRYDWTTGSFPYWSGGSAYTNKHDSSNGGYANLYNCIAYMGYSNSNYYITTQDKGIIKLKAPNNYVNGFYVTNTTYAFKSMKSGDSFAKKFGGPSGNDPDWFKLTVRGYLGGILKPDSSTFYLADYRFSNNASDYIVQNWQYVNCYNLGAVDSIKFFLSSSDVGSFGMNTPGFFSIDNFSTTQGVGINELSSSEKVRIYPNPAHDVISVQLNQSSTFEGQVKLFNSIGAEIGTLPEVKGNTITLNIAELPAGIYFMEANGKTVKFIKD